MSFIHVHVGTKGNEKADKGKGDPTRARQEGGVNKKGAHGEKKRVIVNTAPISKQQALRLQNTSVSYLAVLATQLERRTGSLLFIHPFDDDRGHSVTPGVRPIAILTTEGIT